MIALLHWGVAAASPAIDPASLKHHVEVLASDAYKGRGADGRAGGKTTRYIADAFAAAGLKPGWREKWRQPVPLARRSALGWQMSALDGKGQSVAILPQDVALIGAGRHARVNNAPVIFIGYGVVDPEMGRNDLADADLTGAVVLRLAEAPPEYRAKNKAPPSLASRRALYRSRGALAEIAINDASDDAFIRLQAGYRRGLVRLDDAMPDIGVAGHIRAAAAAGLLASAGVDVAALRRTALSSGFSPSALPLKVNIEVATGITHFRSANVIAVLPGTSRRAEAVVVTAHWDGYGICLPSGAADRICNGAIDNASGVAGLIELGRALKEGPPAQRTILLIATTAEEHGLLGAEYYAAHPVMPLAATAGGVNLDSIALRGRGAKLGIIGKGLTTLDPLIRKIAAGQGRDILEDAELDQYYSRSDQYAFALRGVPMVMVTGLFSRVREKDDPVDIFLQRHYHQPGDEIARIPSFDGAAEDIGVALEVVRHMANDPQMPEWLPHSPYQRKKAAPEP